LWCQNALKMKVLNYLISFLLWVFVAITATILFIGDFLVWLLTFWWDKRLFWLHKYSTVWALFYVWINPGWKINVIGLQKISKDRPYVIVSNHQSAFDIVLLYRINRHFKWVAKRELSRVPVIGWNLILNRCILIDRASAASAKKMVLDSLKHINRGSSILIFPEGTRSKDGKVGRFKEGAFLIAQRAKVPIVPIVIEGSKDILPKPGIVNLFQKLTIKVLDPIPVEQILSLTTDQLTKQVNQIIREEHERLAPNKYNE